MRPINTTVASVGKATSTTDSPARISFSLTIALAHLQRWCLKRGIIGHGPTHQLAAAVDRWTTVLAENNPDTIVALYSKDAVLWGTLSSTVRSDPAGLKAYFVGAFQALPKLTVKFGEQFIRVYGDTAVNTGYYTLFCTKDGEAKSIPARYSFTFVKEGNDCKIVDHHSSAMPAPSR